MKIEFAPVLRFNQVENAATILELSALLDGVGTIDNAQLDLEQLLNEMKSDLPKFGLETEEEFLNEEGFAGAKLAKEKFGQSLMAILDDRSQLLGAAYPYTLEYSDGPVVSAKAASEIGGCGLAWISMSVFNLLEDRELCQISKEDRTGFTAHFEKIFELIAALALAGDCEGVVWWNGASRSRRTFLRQLRHIRNFVGSGRVRGEAELEENQLSVNDGGVDAFAIWTVDGKATPASRCSLLGATLQRTARRQKIVGTPELDRLRSFFNPSPLVTFEGILAIPFDLSESEAQECRNQNCRYFPIEVIYQHLSLLAGRATIPPVQPYRDRLEKNLLSKTRALAEVLTVRLNGRDLSFAPQLNGVV